MSKERELIERLISNGTISSGPADNRVERPNYDPLDQQEMGTYCWYCSVDQIWPRHGPDHTIHESSCPWVEAMELLGHELPDDHFKEGTYFSRP